MPHSLAKIFLSLFGVILIACTTSPLDNVFPTPVSPSASIKLLGYGYKTQPVGNGWNEGNVQLAFENISEGLLGGQKIQVKDPS